MGSTNNRLGRDGFGLAIMDLASCRNGFGLATMGLASRRNWVSLAAMGVALIVAVIYIYIDFCSSLRYYLSLLFSPYLLLS